MDHRPALTEYHSHARTMEGYSEVQSDLEVAVLQNIGANIASVANHIVNVRHIVPSKGGATLLETLMVENIDGQFEPHEWAVIREAALKEASK